MILIDTLYLNSPGGVVILNLIIDELKIHERNILYLLDSRLKDRLWQEPINSIYLKADIFRRHIFYKRNLTAFTKVLCLANISPTIRLNYPVIHIFTM